MTAKKQTIGLPIQTLRGLGRKTDLTLEEYFRLPAAKIRFIHEGPYGPANTERINQFLKNRKAADK